MAHLVGLPPAVDQGRDPARLQRPPCRRRSRPGSCASRSRPGRPWRRPSSRPAPARAAVERASSSAKVSRSSPATTASIGAVERAEGVEQRRQGRRQVGDDRPALRVPADPEAARPRRSRSASTASYLRSSSLGILCSLSRFAFSPAPHYEGASLKGEALIDALLTSLASSRQDAIRFDRLGARSGRARTARLASRLRWYSLAYLVGIILGWWYLLRLLRAARRADGPAPCRRHGLLRDARHHPRRPARLCPVLQAGRLFRTIRSRSSGCGTAACRSTAA